MSDLVLDASVLLKWCAADTERGRGEAARLRAEYEEGRLIVVVPSLIFLELLNVAGHRWGWDEEGLAELASGLEDLGLDVREPEISSVAVWVSRRLTAYDAAYVSLAEQNQIDLVSDDSEILRVAGEVARPLIPSA